MISFGSIVSMVYKRSLRMRKNCVFIITFHQCMKIRYLGHPWSITLPAAETLNVWTSVKGEAYQDTAGSICPWSYLIVSTLISCDTNFVVGIIMPVPVCAKRHICNYQSPIFKPLPRFDTCLNEIVVDMRWVQLCLPPTSLYLRCLS
jgi:hypothetical protein